MSQDAISVGPSLDILEETPETPIVEVSPAASSEEPQETPAETPEETPAEETPSEDDPAGDKPKPNKMGAEEEEADESGDEDASEDAPEENAPIDVAKFSQEYYDSEDGTLSDESYAELEARGLSRDVVDTFMAGVEALQAQRGESLVAIAGSQEEMDSLVAWGTKNLSEAEQAQFNKAVDQAILEGDTTAASMLIPGIKARMSSEPNYVEADTPQGQGGIQPYASKSEMMADMRKPEYSKDPNFVAHVQQRLAITTSF